MKEILLTSAGFIFFIVLSCIFKKIGIFKTEDKHFLSHILLSICLPCVIIGSFEDFQYEISLIVALCMGMLANIGGIFLGAVLTRRRGKDIRTLQMLFCSGYNVGIFTIPFVVSFLPVSALLGTLMFDVGNAVMVLGSTPALVSAIISKERKNPLPAVLKKLSQSIPFVTYVIMTVLALVGITVPKAIYQVADIGAGATAFLAMVIIGILIDFRMPKEDGREVFSILALRYAYATALAILVFFLPFSHEIRKALMIAVFSPTSTASLVFAQKLTDKESVTGVVSTLSIIISMILIVGIVIFV